MRVIQILSEANVAAKIKDPKTMKMLGIAIRHDGSLPKSKLATLGVDVFKSSNDPKKQALNDEKLLSFWSDLLDDSLRSTDYGDISADGKFDEWLTRLYINGIVDYEDINGEGGDALGAWKALSIRGKLKPEHQDFNRFNNLKKIQAIIQGRDYRDELRRIKDQEVIEKHKRERKEVTIIDDERFLVVVPMNYGSCYTFNNSAGFQASFCTGSSSGARWFERYAPDGPMFSVIDKDNYEEANGKWQIHAPTNQVNNGNQTLSYSKGEEKFAELFPGLMKKIAMGLKSKAEEVREASKDIVPGGYDVNKAMAELKDKFPKAYNSGEEEPQEEPGDEGPGTFLVTLIRNGRQAQIQADNEEDVIRRVRERHPSINPEDLRIERVREQN